MGSDARVKADSLWARGGGVVVILMLVAATVVVLLISNAPKDGTQIPARAMGQTGDKTLLSALSTRPGGNMEEDQPWVEVVSWSPRIFIYHNMLTPEECDHIIRLGRSKITPSLVTGAKSDEKTSARSSQGTFLEATIDPLLLKLDELIATWTHIPPENGEAYYLLRYKEGQEYKAHHDFFAGPGRDRYLGAAGQRYATVLTYLEPAEEGGGTSFPKADLQVHPKKGDAVLFYDMTLTGETDYNSLHGGMPVIRGTKWALTKWIRVHAFTQNTVCSQFTCPDAVQELTYCGTPDGPKREAKQRRY